MFDRLVDLLVSWLDLFAVWRILDEWEAGVVLRFGTYNRSIGPGRHWVWPLGVERVISTHTNPDTSVLEAQSLTTADGVAVVVSAVVSWKCTNAKKLLLECSGHEQVMLDASTGVVATHVTGVTWNDLVSTEFQQTLTSAIGQRAKRYGVKVLDVQLRDVARCRSLRLFLPPKAPLPAE